jgi:hypothetical protein
LSNPRDDDLVRERFQDLRADIQGSSGRVPDFRVMMDRAQEGAATIPSLRVESGGTSASRRRRRMLWTGGWASALAAAALAGLLLTSGGEDQDAEFDRLVASFATDASAGAWRSPTSGLLEVPGIELTRSVPSIGGALRGLDPASLPDPPEPQGREDRL